MTKQLILALVLGIALTVAGCCPKQVFGGSNPQATARQALGDDPYVLLAQTFVEHLNKGEYAKAKELSRGAWDGEWVIVEGRGEVPVEELRGQSIDYAETRKRVPGRVAEVPRGEVVLESGLVLEVYKQKEGYRVVSIREGR